MENKKISRGKAFMISTGLFFASTGLTELGLKLNNDPLIAIGLLGMTTFGISTFYNGFKLMKSTPPQEISTTTTDDDTKSKLKNPIKIISNDKGAFDDLGDNELRGMDDDFRDL